VPVRKVKIGWSALLCIANAFLISTCATKRENPAPLGFIAADSTITYTQTIAPMISAYCGACHIAHALGGVSFTSYENVIAHLDRIIARTQSGTMPPYGYAGLSPLQEDTILMWKAGGSKRGTTVTPPVVVKDSAINYAMNIAPMLADRCGACHISDSKGGVSFATYADVIAVIDRIIIRAQSGTMPPSGFLPLTAGQIDTLTVWRASGLPQGSGTPVPAVPIDSSITYTLNVRHLMTGHCSDCHIGDNEGNLSLATYADVKANIDFIIGRVESGTMPPPGSDFSLLTKTQIDTLKIWRVSGERQ
jgi:mono/diheme cytochrome c family protein